LLVTRKVPIAPAEKPVTLSDADITSTRTVTRRSVLGALGIGTGLAAAATVGGLTPTAAADSSDADKGKKPKKKTTTKKPPPKKPKEETDSD
jgi:hypothetical protein